MTNGIVKKKITKIFSFIVIESVRVTSQYESYIIFFSLDFLKKSIILNKETNFIARERFDWQK